MSLMAPARRASPAGRPADGQLQRRRGRGGAPGEPATARALARPAPGAGRRPVGGPVGANRASSRTGPIGPPGATRPQPQARIVRPGEPVRLRPHRRCGEPPERHRRAAAPAAGPAGASGPQGVKGAHVLASTDLRSTARRTAGWDTGQGAGGLRLPVRGPGVRPIVRPLPPAAPPAPAGARRRSRPPPRWTPTAAPLATPWLVAPLAVLLGLDVVASKVPRLQRTTERLSGPARPSGRALGVGRARPRPDRKSRGALVSLSQNRGTGGAPSGPAPGARR